MSEPIKITRIKLTPERREWIRKIFEEREHIAALRKHTKKEAVTEK